MLQACVLLHYFCPTKEQVLLETIGVENCQKQTSTKKIHCDKLTFITSNRLQPHCRGREGMEGTSTNCQKHTRQTFGNMFFLDMNLTNKHNDARYQLADFQFSASHPFLTWENNAQCRYWARLIAFVPIVWEPSSAWRLEDTVDGRHPAPVDVL